MWSKIRNVNVFMKFKWKYILERKERKLFGEEYERMSGVVDGKSCLE